MSRVINCAPYLMHLFITSHYSVVHLVCFAINLPRSCLLYRHAPGTVIEDISNPFGCKNCNHERNNPQPTAAISLSSTIRQCTLWTVAGTLRTTLSIHLNTTPLKSSQHLTMLQSHGSDLFDFPSLFMHINIYIHICTRVERVSLNRWHIECHAEHACLNKKPSILSTQAMPDPKPCSLREQNGSRSLATG